MNSITEKYGPDQAAISPARSEPVVSVRGLVKRYGGHEVVAGLRQLGKTVFLTTHYMDEAEAWPTGSRCSAPGASLTGPANKNDQR
jgi:hypothetical protein